MTRIERARRNVRIARYAIGIVAATGLAAFAAVARASHPGTSHPVRASAAASRGSATSRAGDSSFFGDDSGPASYSNIGPAGSASPQIHSGGA